MNTMISSEIVTVIDQLVASVAEHGFGQVVIVIEHGKPTRLQQMIDYRLRQTAPKSVSTSK